MPPGWVAVVLSWRLAECTVLAPKSGTLRLARAMAASAANAALAWGAWAMATAFIILPTR
jgi:hypothetical protein